MAFSPGENQLYNNVPLKIVIHLCSNLSKLVMSKWARKARIISKTKKGGKWRILSKLQAIDDSSEAYWSVTEGVRQKRRATRAVNA